MKWERKGPMYNKRSDAERSVRLLKQVGGTAKFKIKKTGGKYSIYMDK